MSHPLGALVRLSLAMLGLIAVVGTAASVDASTTGALAIVLSVAALVLLFVVTVGARPHHAALLGRPNSAIDVSALVAQSDPDAAGHARPRAPGHAASAA